MCWAGVGPRESLKPTLSACCSSCLGAWACASLPVGLLDLKALRREFAMRYSKVFSRFLGTLEHFVVLIKS